MRREDGSIGSGMQMECSKCHATETIPVAGNYRALGDARSRKVFQAKGWDVRSTRAFCPECRVAHHEKLHEAGIPTPVRLHPKPVVMPSEPLAIEIEIKPGEISPYIEDVMAEAATPIIREPSREDKRRINAEIAGNWDDQKMRYIGSASDQSVADMLKLPRKWVEDIRVEFYGDSGANEDIDQLKRELDFRIEDVEKLVTTTLEAVSKIDEKLKALKGMRERLERIEKSSLPRGRA